MKKSTILIGQNYLFSCIAQRNYSITEIFDFSFSFLGNNIETKDGCRFDKNIRQNLWELQYASKYVLTNNSKKKIRVLIKEDVGWYGRANFVGKSIDSVHLTPL